MAEVVKTGLLAGRPLWELDEEEMIRACAAYKAGVGVCDRGHDRLARRLEEDEHALALLVALQRRPRRVEVGLDRLGTQNLLDGVGRLPGEP
ncbi:MAG: hypothetical protein ABWY96_04400 [Gaiellaceae bacterium]